MHLLLALLLALAVSSCTSSGGTHGPTVTGHAAVRDPTVPEGTRAQVLRELKRLNPAYVTSPEHVFAVLAEACALSFSGSGNANPDLAVPFLQRALSTPTVHVGRSDAAQVFAVARSTFCH